ncbi:hypothetical protein NVV95_02960 [Herbiconiux sp. CPCC 205716]|uniref:Uncharacterized protein n=1 Tax=Herbiconiux gentiana TaxID=2970912 RepID=A0ABT2GBG1_9MICO|nr:hypothetical protein [Herbiconiux gentiana]MCS5713510.1 hypothetical protein [Herbiconiux gentiana]
MSIDDLGSRQGMSFTASVSEAAVEDASVGVDAMDQLLDRLLVEHGYVIDRLSQT